MTQRTRIGAGLLAAAMVVTLSGCGALNKNEDDTSTRAATSSASVTKTESVSTTTVESIVTSAEASTSVPQSSTTSATSAPTSPVIAPVTKNVSELSGTTVQLSVGGELNINTGDLGVTSYRGDVSDQSVAEFLQGRDDGSARFNPGIKALGPGSATVTLTNKAGGIEPVTFTVNVVG